MVLVDTFVWVSHLRRKSSRLEGLLSDGLVYTHAFVVGELACGNLSHRQEILSLLQELPSAMVASQQEVITYIEKHKLMGQGLGFIDIHLLVSATLSRLSIWTEDKKLHHFARQLQLA